METLSYRIVAAARGWVGTRFHHQGRLKKTDRHRGGCDCLGLLVGVAHELEFKVNMGGQTRSLASFDTTNYTHTPNGEALREGLAQVLEEIPLALLAPGDIAMFEIDRNPQHLAIISDYSSENYSGSLCAPRNRSHGLGMIHAYAPARAVVEHQFDETWRERMRAAFRIY
jgi:hypothetical protein